MMEIPYDCTFLPQQHGCGGAMSQSKKRQRRQRVQGDDSTQATATSTATTSKHHHLHLSSVTSSAACFVKATACFSLLSFAASFQQSPIVPTFSSRFLTLGSRSSLAHPPTLIQRQVLTEPAEAALFSMLEDDDETVSPLDSQEALWLKEKADLNRIFAFNTNDNNNNNNNNNNNEMDSESFIPYSELQLHQLQQQKPKQSLNNNVNNSNFRDQPTNRPVFKGLSTTARKRKHTTKSLEQLQAASPSSTQNKRPRANKSETRNSPVLVKSKKPKTSRSSTMPGFSVTSARQQAYKDTVRRAEHRLGRTIVDTPQERKQRRKAAGETMYRSAAPVPDSMIQFASEIHQQDRITRQQEKELGAKTQEAVRLQNLYDALRLKLNREPSDEEWCAAAGKINMEAIRQAIDEGLEAKNELVTSNLRMVQSVVNTYIRNGLSSQYNAADMMQDGILALIRAAEKFEPDRGWKFSTYAMYWVRASVKRSQVYQSRIVTVPHRLHENYKRLSNVQAELTASMGRPPSRAEMGQQVGMSELQVDRCIAAMEQRCFSLDQELVNRHRVSQGTPSSRDTLIDLVDTTSDSGDYDRIERVFLLEDLVETLHRHLSEDEANLLLLRYGLRETHLNQFQSNKKLTIAELSETVGLKPDKVRRMIKTSLTRLKHVAPEEWAEFRRVLA